MKLLSIIVPCYNSEPFMEKCIESLLVGGDRVEIIIIDDGSKDRTGAIADEFALQYPDIIKVVHQPNGGHGEGINVGLGQATGKFVKSVDSDDTLSADFPAFLDALETGAKDADLIVNNYVYTYDDPSKNNAIRYRNIFKANEIIGWEDTKKFKIDQFLMIHACTFRTELARKYGPELPKHTFYEDNLYVGRVKPHVDKIYYLDMDLYNYTIGREGQSMAPEVMAKRYTHQILVCQTLFNDWNLEAIKMKSKKLYKILMHEMEIMYAGACAFAMLGSDENYYENLQKMWKMAFEHDEKNAKKLRYGFLRFMNLKGKFGRKTGIFIYNLAHKIVKFN